MNYAQHHAAKALEIMRRLLPHVEARREYLDLIAILEQPARWKEAHDQFTAIRTRITLPNERKKKEGADACFAYVAECAAKTAYNCSGESAPFDESSFDWLLRCEREFIAELKKEANQSLQTTTMAVTDAAQQHPRQS
jgi:hypothetical protein